MATRPNSIPNPDPHKALYHRCFIRASSYLQLYIYNCVHVLPGETVSLPLLCQTPRSFIFGSGNKAAPISPRRVEVEKWREQRTARRSSERQRALTRKLAPGRCCCHTSGAQDTGVKWYIRRAHVSGGSRTHDRLEIYTILRSYHMASLSLLHRHGGGHRHLHRLCCFSRGIDRVLSTGDDVGWNSSCYLQQSTGVCASFAYVAPT